MGRLVSYLAAPPCSLGPGAGAGGGPAAGAAASGRSPATSPSGSMVSWSTAQETEERNSLCRDLSLVSPLLPGEASLASLSRALTLSLTPDSPGDSSSPSSPCWPVLLRSLRHMSSLRGGRRSALSPWPCATLSLRYRTLLQIRVEIQQRGKCHT